MVICIHLSNRKEGFDVGKFCNDDFQLNIVGKGMIKTGSYPVYYLCS